MATTLNLLPTTTPPPPLSLSLSAPPSSSPQLHSLSFNFRHKHSKPISLVTPQAALSDPFVLQIAETLEDSLSPTSSPPSPPLDQLRLSSSESLLSLSWPTRKDEPFRFTDTSFIKSSQIHPVSPPSNQKIQSLGNLKDTQMRNLVVFADGYVVDSLSSLEGLPEGVFVGSVGKVSDDAVLKRVCEILGEFDDGDLFWSLNGVGAPELVVVYVPEGCKVEEPVNLRYCSVEGSGSGSKAMPVSSPRVLVVVEKGGEVGIVEEYVGGEEGLCYWTNSVLEVAIGEGASFSHTYVQSQSLAAAHTKWTSVRQVYV